MSCAVSYGPAAGIPVLWLHGWMGHGGEGEALQKLLGENVQLVCPDLPGHGSRPIGESTLDDLLRDIAEWGKHCQAAIGYSMGGRLLMMAAARSPQAFHHLIIESSHPGLASPEERVQRKDIDAARAQDLIEKGFSGFCREWYAAEMWNGLSPTEKKGSPRDCAAALKLFSLSHQPDLRPWLCTTQSRILWLAGKRDRAYVDHADWVRNTTRHKVTLLDSGHNVHAQCSAEWAEQVRAFLQSIETSQELLS